MPIDDYTKPHFSIPRMPNFLSPEVKLVLTEESKRAFAEACPKQGFVGLVELPDPDNPDDDPLVAKIHLLPAFNKNDGLVRVNKEGKPFSTKVIESQMELGTMTGDLHTYAVSALSLGLKGGAKGLIMGFGVWKSGCGVRIMDSLPSANARVANEYILVKGQDSEWNLYFSDENCEALEIEIRPELANILAKLPDKTPRELDWEDRKELAAYLRTKTIYGRREKEGELGFAKNRSSSQNAFACQYSTSFKTYFDTALHDRKSAHSLNLPRELPFSVFEKILTGVSEELKIEVLKDLLNNPKIPTGWIGPRLHFSWEVAWSKYSPEKRMTEIYIWALLHKREDILEYLFTRGDRIDFNHPLSLAGKRQPMIGVGLHTNDALPLHLAILQNAPLLVEFLLNHGADPLKEHSGFNSFALLEKLLRVKPDREKDADFQKISSLLLKKVLQQGLEKFEDINIPTRLLKFACISQDEETMKALVKQLPISTFLAAINQLAETNKELLSLELLGILLPLFSEDERFELAKGLGIGSEEEFLPLFFPAIANIAENFLQAREEERLNPATLEEIKELTKVEQRAFWNFIIAKSSHSTEIYAKLMPYLPDGIYRCLMLETAAAKDPKFYQDRRNLVENLRLIPLEERPIELMKKALSLRVSQELLALLPKEEQINFMVELIAYEAYPVCHRKKIEDLLLYLPKELRLSVLVTPSQRNQRSAVEEIFPGRAQIPDYELRKEYQSLLEEMKRVLKALPEKDRLAALNTQDSSGSTPFHHVDLSPFLCPILETLPEEDRALLLTARNSKGTTILHSLIEKRLSSYFRKTPDDFIVEEKEIDDPFVPNDIWSDLGAKDTESLEEQRADMEGYKKECQEEIALLTRAITLIPLEDRAAALSEKNHQGKTILHSLLGLTQKTPQAFFPIDTALEIIHLVPIHERHTLLAEGERKNILLCSGIDNYFRLLSTLPPKDIVKELTTPKSLNGKTMLEQVPKTHREVAERIFAKAKEELTPPVPPAQDEQKPSSLRSFSLFKEQRLKPAGEVPEVKPDGPG